MNINSDEQQLIHPQVKYSIPDALDILPYIFSYVPPQFVCNNKIKLLKTNRNSVEIEKLENIMEKNISSANKNQNTILNSSDLIYQKYEVLNNNQIYDNLIKCTIYNKQHERIWIQNECIHYNKPNQNLMFQSNFQSGNLNKVFQINEGEYNLMLHHDFNTRSFTQWFFFKVFIHKPAKIKFNIVNFYKQKSLFTKGMKLVSLTTKKQVTNRQIWKRSGTQIQYYKNQLNINHRNSYTLTFKYQFQQQNSQVYFAYHYPYTYSDLIEYIKKISDEKLSTVKINVLCQTLCNNYVYYLTITQNLPIINQKKQIIYLSARTHPGQVVSSYLIQYLINFLLSNSPVAQQLRKKFIFKIIPMMNPDGVIHGNSRCSLVGKDLNRRWQHPDKQTIPQIYSLKNLILKDFKKHKIFMVCDFHGHSVKKGSFIFGCHNKFKPFQTREFPWILSKLNPHFDYLSCSFRIKKQKLGTLRVNLWRSLKISNIFTFQTSLCGPLDTQNHWSNTNLNNLAVDFCKSIKILWQQKLEKTNKNIQKKYLSSLYENNQNYLCNISNQQSQNEISDKQIIQTQKSINNTKKQIIESTKTLKIYNKFKKFSEFLPNRSVYKCKTESVSQSLGIQKIQKIQHDLVSKFNKKSRICQQKSILYMSQDQINTNLFIDNVIKKNWSIEKTNEKKFYYIKSLSQKNKQSMTIHAQHSHTNTQNTLYKTKDLQDSNISVQKMTPLKVNRKKTYIYKGRNLNYQVKQKLKQKNQKIFSGYESLSKFKKKFLINQQKLKNQILKFLNTQQKNQFKLIEKCKKNVENL